jgi:broad specificity phosphatase PhoE
MAVDAAKALEGATSPPSSPRPLQRAQETARPTAELFGLPIHTDDRLIESGNYFEGKTVGVGDGAFSDPKHWPQLRNPFTPSWGEPYVEIARRMLAAAEAARDRALGHEAVCVSHQLPIWTVRRYVEGASSGTARTAASAASRR